MPYSRYSFFWVMTIIGAFAGTATVLFLLYNTDSYKAREVAWEKQAIADQKPRIIEEKDGCKVYAFKAGGYWHYFTRCPAETTTESNWTEPSGKTRVRKSDTITTENK